MALSYKARRRWSLVLLLIWMPVYIILCIGIIAMLPPLHFILQFVMYLVLGVAWALPFKSLFRGVGKPDPDAPVDPET
ncbi:hypothetical protein GCM10007939_08880 [Amylibacter marinus]|uniref:DUF2842 domain-containing protein n=1 Tax=Amylibacter marinus TaxID=1475483 RepID=A0ABQ5VTD8_9RHOB|nr:DUF2842 domain-containing protein [Amylibacter marinus]GLQ34605.1 hypothetical protein GCM10007939_08880 [Amylibacter marinus]